MNKLFTLTLIGIALLANTATAQIQRTVDTLNDLTNAPPISFASESSTAGIKATVRLRGLNSVTDGMGGLFTWSTTSTSTTNAYDTFAGNGLTTGRWLRLSTPVALLDTKTSGVTTFMGRMPMVAGTVTITNAFITTNSYLFLTQEGAVTNASGLTYTIAAAGGAATVYSGFQSATGTNFIKWLLITPPQ